MTSLVWVVAVVGTRGLLWLLALRLQLRWHAQRQQERHRYSTWSRSLVPSRRAARSMRDSRMARG